MKNLFCGCVLLGVSFTGLSPAVAQTMQFFRVSGPTAITITAFCPDGTLAFTNAQLGATYTVQTVTGLPGSTNWVDYIQIPATNTEVASQILDFHPPSGMAFIPPGSFTMGDIADTNIEGDAAPVSVYVSGFYIDQYDVTSDLWEQVRNWAITNGYSFAAGWAKGANHPVYGLDWYDCVKWCNARSEMMELTPAYYTTAAQTTVYRSGEIDISNCCVNWSDGYRLPTEAEWEKAARGGLNGQRFPCGNTISWSQANYYGDPLSRDSNGYAYDLATAIDNDPFFDDGIYPYTSPVGSFAPNGYGLYDMAGNVWDWCWDWYGVPYEGGRDPRGPVSGSSRVDRGGGWQYYAYDCRSAFRYPLGPMSDTVGNSGFRTVLSPSK